jgi:hypothetical protein
MSSRKAFGVEISANDKILAPTDLGIKYIYQCKRGFWWGLSAEIGRVDCKESWVPNKILLYTKEPHLKVLRTKVSNHNCTNLHKLQEIKIHSGDLVRTVITNQAL